MKTIFLVSQGQKCSGHNLSGGNFSNKKKNYDRAPDEFLTIKNDDDQHFNFRQPEAFVGFSYFIPDNLPSKE